jgi:hypothetical protein
LLASEFCFESAKDDPIARRLLINSISYLHDQYQDTVCQIVADKFFTNSATVQQ